MLVHAPVTAKAPPRNKSTPGSPAPVFHSPFAPLASLDLPIGQAAAQVDLPPHSRPGGAGAIDLPPHSRSGSAARAGDPGKSLTRGGAGAIDLPPHSRSGSAARPGGAGAIDTATPLAAGPTGPARAVVRLERKHRRGKEVTVVEKLGLSAEELEIWCRDLKRTLGCGGGVEQAAIVLQGDFRTRLPDALGKLGVRRVTVSG